MKVARKRIYALNDDFEASERGARVRITRHRSTVLINAEDRSGGNVQCELTLDELAQILVTHTRDIMPKEQ